MPDPTTSTGAIVNGEGGRRPSLLERFETHKDKISLVAMLVVVALAAVALEQLLREVRFADVRRAILAIGGWSVVESLLFSALSFLALVGYDYSALRYIRRKVALGIVALTSFCGYAIGNTVGFTLLSGGSIRLRLYSRAGLRTDEIARVAVFCIVAWGFGVCIVSGLGVMFRPSLLARLTGVSTSLLIGLGVALLVAVVAFIVLCAVRGEIVVRGRRFILPSASLVMAQLLISAIDIVFAAAALFALLPGDTRPAFSEFLTVFCAAIVAGIMSHVPGGLGVFEAVLLAALGDRMGADKLLAALVAYRLIYYILPLVVAAVLLSVLEIRHYRARGVVAPTVTPTRDEPLAALIPDVYSALMVVGSVLALMAAVVINPGPFGPSTAWQWREVSPFLGPFLVGFAACGLLAWSRAIANCLRGAVINIVMLSLLLAGAFALIYHAWLASALCVAALGPLLIARGEFHRRCENIFLMSRPLLVGWLIATGVLLAANLVIHPFDNDVSRRVLVLSSVWLSRALVCALGGGAALIMLAAAGWARGRQQRRAPLASADDRGRALALIGERDDLRPLACWPARPSLLFSRSAASALIYFATARGRVAMFAPFGATEERQDVLFDFMELCRIDRQDFIILYLKEADLPLYLDRGLAIGRWSSEARIALQAFNPSRSSAESGLLGTLRWGEEQGLLARRLRAGEGESSLVAPPFVANADLAPYRDSWGVVGTAGVLAVAHVLRSERRREAILLAGQLAPDQPTRLLDLLLLGIVGELKALGFQSLFLGHGYAARPLNRLLQPFRGALDRAAAESGAALTYFRLSPALIAHFKPLWETRYAAYPRRQRALALLAGVERNLIPPPSASPPMP